MRSKEDDAARGRAEIVTVRLQADEKNALAQLAEKEGVPVAEMTRRLLRLGVTNYAREVGIPPSS